MTERALTIVSWNVLADSYVQPQWFPYTEPALLDPTTRRPRLVQRVVDLAHSDESPADVFCLQEVEPEVFASMRDALGAFEGRWVGKVGKPDGCAVLVRRALGPISFRDMTFRDGTGHIAVAATVDGDGSTTSFATTHLKWQAATVPPAERLGRAELLEVLQGWVRPSERWVVCGDLNAPSDSPVLEAAFAHGLLDAYATMPEASTCNSNARAKRIDFVLHTKHFTSTPVALPVINDTTPLPSATEPSDHLAIKAVLVAAGIAMLAACANPGTFASASASASASAWASADPPPVPGEPLGSLLSNAPTTSSSPVADADRVIVSIRPKLEECYAKEKGARGTDLAGMVTCGVRITKEGKVGAVGVTRRSRLPNPLVDCIKREISRARFEPRAEEAVIMVPVRFALPDDPGD